MQHFANFGIVKKANKQLKRNTYVSESGNGIDKNWSDVRQTDDKAASATGYLGFRKDPYKGYGGMMEESIPHKDFWTTHESKILGSKAKIDQELHLNDALTAVRERVRVIEPKDPLKQFIGRSSNGDLRHRGDSRITSRVESGLPQLTSGDRSRAYSIKNK